MKTKASDARSRPLVLLCEDEPIVAMDIQMMLEDAGYEIAGPYACVTDALDAINNINPDVALLDVRLRDGEVFPAAERLKQNGVPLIFHSGHIVEDNVADRFPKALHCPKPVMPDVLLGTIQSACVKADCTQE